MPVTAAQVKELRETHINPKLAVIMVGDDKASTSASWSQLPVFFINFLKNHYV